MNKVYDKINLYMKDFLSILFLLLLGLVLVGYFVNYEYIITGYQDWIYHAFRVESLDNFGIVSWDNKWANGLNYWRSYQYYPHFLSLFIKNIFNVTAAKSLILLSIFIFIFLRIVSFFVLRSQKVPTRESLIAVCLSYLSLHNWAMKDFSIFIALLTLPIFIFFWILSTKDNKFYPLTATIAGISWLFHPVIGLSLTSLLALDVILNRSLEIFSKLLVGIVFIFATISFWLPFLSSGYKFSSPFLSSTEFVVMSSGDSTFGLGSLFFIALACGWFAIIFFSKNLNYWTKIIILHTTIACGYFLLARNGHLPPILNSLQFQRSNVFFAFSMPFFFAPSLAILLEKARSRFFNILIAGILAVIFVVAIDSQSRWAGIPTKQIDHSVAEYFSNTDTISGSVYYSNESEFSYFSDHEIRLVGSYNEHLLPSPLSSIFKSYLTRIEYSSTVTQDSLQKISDYMTVLGVEYLVVGQHSPIAAETKQGLVSFLEEVDVITQGNDNFSILKNKNRINSAYILENADLDALGNDEFTNPTLNNISYEPWNNQVRKLAELIRSEKVIPVGVNYDSPETIKVYLGSYDYINNPTLLLATNHSKYWSASNGSNVSATNLKLIALQLNGESEVVLKHSWPKYHWPVQAIAPFSVLASIIGILTYDFYKKYRNRE